MLWNWERRRPRREQGHTDTVAYSMKCFKMEWEVACQYVSCQENIEHVWSDPYSKPITQDHIFVMMEYSISSAVLNPKGWKHCSCAIFSRSVMFFVVVDWNSRIAVLNQPLSLICNCVISFSGHWPSWPFLWLIVQCTYSQRNNTKLIAYSDIIFGHVKL